MIQFNNIALNVNPDGSTSQAAGSDRAAQTQPPVLQNASDEILKQLTDNTAATDSRSSAEVVLQALRAAGLSPSEANIDVVNLLIQNNMPISRESIRQTLAQIHAYPALDAEAIINMNKASVPVNAESVETVREFLANESIISSDIEELTDMVGTLLSDNSLSAESAAALRSAVTDYLTAELQNAILSGAPSNAASLQSASVNATLYPAGTAASEPSSPEASGQAVAEIAALAAEQQLSPGEGSLSNGVSIGNDSVQPDIEAGSDSAMQQNIEAQTDLVGESAADAGGSHGVLENQINAEGTNISPSDSTGILFAEGTNVPGAASAGINSTVDDSLQDPNSPVNLPNDERLANDGRYDYSFSSFEELTQKISESAPNPSSSEALGAAIREELGKLSPADLKKLLRSSLLIRPKDLSKENVKALYERTNSFITKVKEKTQSDELSAVNSKAAAAQKDLEMLNSLTRVHPHIELPLKLKDSEAKGGLYVYTNRKDKIEQDGHYTALLHLNLPSLGPIDIHMDLNSKNLKLSFYSEEAAGKLLKSDVESLHSALNKLDFSVISQFRELAAMKEDLASPVKSAEQTIHNEVPSGKLGFDQRA